MASCFVAGMVIYSLGPNVVVGAVGTLGFGFAAMNDKVKKIFAEKVLSKTNNNEDREKALKNVKLVDKSLDSHLQTCSLFAWSAIPVFGPFIALKKWRS